MGLGGSRGDSEQAIGHWLGIGHWSRRGEHRSAFAAKPETDYLYGAVVRRADTAMNARPTAKPFSLYAIISKDYTTFDNIK